ncbi:uncharacterized protein LOC144108040 [Amblyomma americanum]
MLPFPGSSTAAELARLHLAADLIATIPPGPVVVLCDSRPALQLLSRPLHNVATTSLLRARLQTLEDAGHQIYLHWVPGHSGIEGNDLADALGKSAHTDGTGPSPRPEDCGLQAIPPALRPATQAGPSPPSEPPHRLHVDAL